MNAQPLEKQKMTVEAYLEIEREEKTKSEYFEGELFAMTGASLNHNRINHNVSGELRNRLKLAPCEALSSDMRVKIEKIEKYTYPDIVIACKEIHMERRQGVETLLNPIVIIEILSDATEAYDRGLKFYHYRLIPSLQEYILISQNHCLVERFLRQSDGTWGLSSYEGMDAVLYIASVDCEVPLSEIYSRVVIDGDGQSALDNLS